VGFVADKVVLWQVFFEYFGFLCQFLFCCSTLIIIYHLGPVQLAK
jgi:hypothetical protein